MDRCLAAAQALSLWIRSLMQGIAQAYGRIVCCLLGLSVLQLWLAAGVQAQLLQDPTRPPGRAQVAAPPAALRVEAILIASERRVVIVNGQLLRTGDWVEGAQIAEIQADRVTFRRNGRSFTAHLSRAAMRVRQPSTIEDSP